MAMWKFIKHYALEIYTVLAMLFMVATSFMGDLSAIQLFVAVFNFLFVLHEWEESRYPGGFLELITSLIEKEVPEETRRASRIPTSILIFTMVLLPFFFDDVTLFAMATATFGIFEGFIHVIGIRIFRLKKRYTPGLVTAEMELTTSIFLVIYLAYNHLGTWYDYIFGPLLFFVCFAMMQKTLTLMVGIKYSDMPKLMKKQLARK